MVRFNYNTIVAVSFNGAYVNLDGRDVNDLDGKKLAAELDKLGFDILEYHDTGRNGLVTTECGLRMSTNGYVSRVVS